MSTAKTQRRREKNMNKFLIDKKIVQKSFSKAAHTYDTYARLQKYTAEELLRITDRVDFSLKEAKSFITLDIGCGTGRFARSFKKLFPNSNMVMCDFSLPMLLKAKENNRENKIKLLSSDCDDLPFGDSFFDCIVSNLAFQWTPDGAATFREIQRVLKPGGLLLFSILGSNTLKEFRESYEKTIGTVDNDAYPPFMKFYETEALSGLLKNCGFEVLVKVKMPKMKNYKNLWDLLRTLKATGTSPNLPNGKKGLARGLWLKKTAKNYEKLFPASDGPGISATYDVIYSAARKKL